MAHRSALPTRILLSRVPRTYAEALCSLVERYGAEAVCTDSDPVAASDGSEFALCVLGSDADGARTCERVRQIRKGFPRAPLVVLAEGIDTDHVVRLMRLGVADLIGLPAPVGDVASRALDHMMSGGEGCGSGTLVGESRVMQELRREMELVAATRSTVLLTGETGTGKGLVARLIHERSDRCDDPFVHLDCTGLSPTLIESELFGHERGAFTGATGHHRGRFEAAGRGTVFLDEIGDLDPTLQAKLLRVLHDRTFERVGGTRTLPMNARVVAATNADLRKRVGEGVFRSDLYFRLKVFHLHVPPLRERPEDIPLLVRGGLDPVAERLGVAVPPLTDGFLERLQRYSWPGNVRELLNVLERLLVSSGGRPLEDEDLDGVLEESDSLSASEVFSALPEASHSFEEDLRSASASDPSGDGAALSGREEEERRRIAAVLRDVGGNVARAARRLGMPRSTLRYRIRRYGLGELLPRD